MADEPARTLAMYFASGDFPADVGRSLHIHRHTVQYGLGIAARLVNGDFADPDDRLLLQLAALLARGSIELS